MPEMIPHSKTLLRMAQHDSIHGGLARFRLYHGDVQFRLK